MVGMDNIQDILTKYKKEIGGIQELCKKLAIALESGKEDIKRAEEYVQKLEKGLGKLRKSVPIMQVLQEWLEQKKSLLENLKVNLKERFGLELEQELKKIGLTLSGHYPELRTWLLTIEVNFPNNRAILWYGPKQEKVKVCSLSPQKISQEVDHIRTNLGAKLPKEELLQKLYQAYHRTEKGAIGEPAPIIEVLRELAFLLQPSSFWTDPRKENYKDYSRADFSYDLFRLRDNQSFKLIIATRAFTNSRTKFIWVPMSESGNGATYSHIQFKENLFK
jgi:hypothetical protein